jgi:nickel/cobalt transporter (NiCoT) family protein
MRLPGNRPGNRRGERPGTAPLPPGAPTAPAGLADLADLAGRPVDRSWRRRGTYRAAGLLAVIAVMHAAAFGILLVLVVPHHYHAAGGQAFGFGLGITAYTLGMRHAFDADHIAAIDNTTRKLMSDGKRPVSVGFWFALGHSTVVLLLAALISAGAREATSLTGRASHTHQTLALIGTAASGAFLYLIAVLNLVAFAAIAKLYRAARGGRYSEALLEEHLGKRGLLNRILGRLTRSVTRPGQMYPVGLLFGIGFDTATEVLLLGMAAGSAAAGLPWYAAVCLPLLFAAGMSLFDTLDGTFMNVAYQWAFASPARKVYYNLAVTGLSVAVALVVGTIELAGVAHDRLGLHDPLTGWLANLNLNNAGFVLAGLFAAVWAAALSYWKITRAGRRATRDS